MGTGEEETLALRTGIYLAKTGSGTRLVRDDQCCPLPAERVD
jgi:hypothetical protein